MFFLELDFSSQKILTKLKNFR